MQVHLILKINWLVLALDVSSGLVIGWALAVVLELETELNLGNIYELELKDQRGKVRKNI
jgi:hypothetical protein